MKCARKRLQRLILKKIKKELDSRLSLKSEEQVYYKYYNH